jgi:hypothetical protein
MLTSSFRSMRMLTLAIATLLVVGVLTVAYVYSAQGQPSHKDPPNSVPTADAKKVREAQATKAAYEDESWQHGRCQERQIWYARA